MLGLGIALGLMCVVLVAHFAARNPMTIRGAVVATDPDPAKELPLGDVEITLPQGPPGSSVRSNASGYFQLPLPWRMRVNSEVTLHFSHSDYQPFDLRATGGDRLYVVHMAPLLPRQNSTISQTPELTISNVVAKYSVNTISQVNVGSAVKTFRVVNTGNVPCNGRDPCSPDGRWKAAIGSATLDAGRGNELHNARAACIAGPCPFTRIEDNHTRLSANNQTFHASALNWSDTTTFVLEAEVFKSIASDVLRQSYPVILDRAFTFTLPPAAEGVSIEAELNGDRIVFPLGPSLFLSWANCQVLVNKDQTKVYRCEIKPGYRFS